MIYLETYTYQFTCKYDKTISNFLSLLYKYFILPVQLNKTKVFYQFFYSIIRIKSCSF